MSNGRRIKATQFGFTSLAEWKADRRKTMFPDSVRWGNEWQHVVSHQKKFPDFLQKQIYTFDKLVEKLEVEEHRTFDLCCEFDNPDLDVLLNYYFWLRCSLLQPIGLVFAVVISTTESQLYNLPRQGPLTKPSEIEAVFLEAEKLYGMECRDATVARELADYKSTLCSPQRGAAKCEAIMEGYDARVSRAQEALARPSALYDSFRAWRSGSSIAAAKLFKDTYSMTSPAWRPTDLSVDEVNSIERSLRERIAEANEEWVKFYEVNMYTNLLHPVLLQLAEEREDEEIEEEERKKRQKEK